MQRCLLTVLRTTLRRQTENPDMAGRYSLQCLREAAMSSCRTQRQMKYTFQRLLHLQTAFDLEKFSSEGANSTTAAMHTRAYMSTMTKISQSPCSVFSLTSIALYVIALISVPLS